MESCGKTAILILAPETGRLPDGMGKLARFISGKCGGLGEVVAALCEGLAERGISCHLATLHLKRRFQAECRLDDTQWQEVRHTIDPERIHLVNSAVFADLPSAYAGNPRLNAAEFQKTLVNQIIVRICACNGGRLILHSHDWMAGGVVTAYAKARGLPVLHTVHNVHTGHIPLALLGGVDLQELSPHLYFSRDHDDVAVDCQATAIKNATLINFVGETFLAEIMNDYFLDRPVIPHSVRQEIKEKYYHGQTMSIISSPSPQLYPERCPCLPVQYGPEDDVFTAKRQSLVKFQQRTGLTVNPDAILLYWPSRLDPCQKGIELLEHIAQQFVIAHEDVQIAVVGSGVGNDRTHEDIMGRIAWASEGQITYQRFNEDISLLGYAAAHDVFGASLYEPCGQIDQIGNLYGATATNRDTGGYHDKIRELDIDHLLHSDGNGFLFYDYDPGGLWHGLEKSVRFHRLPSDVQMPVIRRIMRDTRRKYDLTVMVDAYVQAYERLNNNEPLV